MVIFADLTLVKNCKHTLFIAFMARNEHNAALWPLPPDIPLSSAPRKLEGPR